jgi:hypothetical protein
MISETSPLFLFGHRIADAVNPTLALCLLGFLIVSTRRREVGWRIWLAAVLGIALVYLLRALDRRADLWDKIGADFSTHSAVAAAAIVPMIVVRRRLWPLLLGIFLCYAVLMVVLGFHSLLDIASTLLVVVPLLVLLYLALTGRSFRANTESEDSTTPIA